MTDDVEEKGREIKKARKHDKSKGKRCVEYKTLENIKKIKLDE